MLCCALWMAFCQCQASNYLNFFEAMRTLSAQIFGTENVIHSVSQSDYEHLDGLKSIFESFTRTSYQSVFVLDFCKRNYFYVSERPLFLSDMLSEDFQKGGLPLFLRRIPPHELRKLGEVCQMGFRLFREQPLASRSECVISYDFHLVDKGRQVLVHHKLTPLLMTKQKELWMALCVFSLSPHKTDGHVVFRNKRLDKTWVYSFCCHQWKVQERVLLTQEEKKMLAYSAQGHSREEIGRLLGKSVDTVKRYRGQLFDKLGVDNITEAISYASTYGLI